MLYSMHNKALKRLLKELWKWRKYSLETMTGDRATRRCISLISAPLASPPTKKSAVFDGVLHVRLLKQGEALLFASLTAGCF